MKASILTISLTMLTWILPSHAANSVSYRVTDRHPVKNALVQIVSFDRIGVLRRDSVQKINSSLITTAASFDREAKQCGTYAQDRPWEYKLNFEKVHLSPKYLSVVFSKFTVCAGSPDIEKEARVFSLPSGRIIPAKILYKKLFPAAARRSGVSSNTELIQLDEEMAERVIDDSREAVKIRDGHCEFFLKNTSYRIWIKGRNAIFFPEFSQVQSICQKEYAVKIDG